MMSQYVKVITSPVRNLCKSSLIGRELVGPKCLNPDEIKSILWTALELKEIVELQEQMGFQALIKGKRVAFLATEDTLDYFSLASASHLLQVSLDKVILPKWDIASASDLLDIKKFLEVNCDIIFAQSTRYFNILKMAKDKCSVPFISIKNGRYAIPHTIADAMTIYQRYNKLQNVNVTWLGAPCNLMFSDMCVFSRLGINLNVCPCSDPDSPITVIVSEEARLLNPPGVKLKEFMECKEAMVDCDVLIINDSTGFKQVTNMDLANAHSNYIVIQKFPRKIGAIDNQLEDRNLIWDNCNNMVYVLAALMLRFTTGYDHKTPPPSFIS